MDLPSGFNVENWDNEGNFDIPVNEDVSLVLAEDATSKRMINLPSIEIAGPSMHCSIRQQEKPYNPDTIMSEIVLPGVADACEGLTSHLEARVVLDRVELTEQQFIEQHVLKASRQSEISNIPLPIETDFPTQSLVHTGKTEELNLTVNDTAQIENSRATLTENLNGLPFPQETSSALVDEAVATPDLTVPKQETILTTPIEAEPQTSEELIIPDQVIGTETEICENIVSETVVEEPPQLAKIEMTEVASREPEDLLADLNSSEEATESLDETTIEYDNAESVLPDMAVELEGNLAPAANGKSVIDLVLPVVDSSSVTMTDPVLLRPAKPTVATRKTVQATREEEIADTFYTLPAHVIGRPTGNPTDEQKLRPGIKSPMGHLRSQILSKNDIAQELQERTQKNAAYKYPEKGDIFFAKTLTKRLASHINDKAEIYSSGVDSKAGIAKLATLPPTLSAFKESKAKNSLPQTSTKTAPSDDKHDDTDLLAILEGEVDDWTIDRPPPQLIEAASSPINIQSHPPKLDPSVERELALQQLSNMPVRQKKAPSLTKTPAKKTPRKTPIKARREFEDGEVDPSERPLRKRKADTPVVLPKKSIPHSNGASSSVVVAGKDVNKNIAKVETTETEAKQPRIFKTKRRAGVLTNGTTSVPTMLSKPSTSKEVADEAKPKAKAAEAVDAPALITRELISPPRTYSSRIKKSTFSDDFVFPSTSKSRVVPVVGGPPKPAKKAVKPAPAKAEAATAGDVTPVAVKRAVGRPAKSTPKAAPKKAKPADTPTPEPAKSHAAKSPKKIPKKLSEIDRLLMDEGAINMLYSVEQNEEKRRSGGGAEEPAVRKRLVKTTRHFHKELLMKTRLVKSAVQRLRNTPDATAVSLRTKRAAAAAAPKRKTSIDSNVSLTSPPPLTPAEPSSPTQVFSYPPRLRTPAEASRIIRRHSSSSNFSSRSGSPSNSRRLSFDVAADDDEADAPVARETRKRGSNLYITKLQSPTSAKKKKTTRTASVEDAIFQPNVKVGEELLSPGSKTKLQSQMAKNFQKAVKVKKAAAATPSTNEAAKGKAPPDLTACLAEAVTAFIADDGNLDSSNVPPGLSSDGCLAPPLSPSAGLSYSSLIKALEVDCQRRADDSAKERTSPRQSVGLGNYKELSIRRHDNMVQIILAPVSTKMMDSLNPQVLKELQDVLTHLQKDDTCRAVLLTSSGSAFCLGVDFHSLIVERADKRRAAAQQFALALKHFMTGLSQFGKPIVAGVHGAAVGLGVTMLPFFDMVFASDRATFHTPYARLGQVPEGAAVVALPQLLGNAVTSELLYTCRKLTASEALQYGLVTRVLWPDRFHEELLPLVNTLAAQSAQSMEATKALLRYNLRARVDAALESEAQLLVQHWSSAECQANFKRFLDDEDVGLQRQRSADV